MISVIYSQHTHAVGDVVTTSGYGPGRLLPGIKLLSITASCRFVVAATGRAIPEDLVVGSLVMWHPSKASDSFVCDNSLSAGLIDRGTFFNLSSNETYQKRFQENFLPDQVSFQFRSILTDGFVLGSDLTCYFWVEVEYTRDAFRR